MKPSPKVLARGRCRGSEPNLWSDVIEMAGAQLRPTPPLLTNPRSGRSDVLGTQTKKPHRAACRSAGQDARTNPMSNHCTNPKKLGNMPSTASAGPCPDELSVFPFPSGAFAARVCVDIGCIPRGCIEILASSLSTFLWRSEAEFTMQACRIRMLLLSSRIPIRGLFFVPARGIRINT